MSFPAMSLAGIATQYAQRGMELLRRHERDTRRARRTDAERRSELVEARQCLQRAVETIERYEREIYEE